MKELLEGAKSEETDEPTLYQRWQGETQQGYGTFESLRRAFAKSQGLEG